MSAIILSRGSCLRYVGRQLQPVCLSSGLRRAGSTSAGADACGDGTDAVGDATSKPLAQLARTAALPDKNEKQLSKFQRASLGLAGSALTAGGLGGYAWLHWPLLGTSGLCALAGGCGTALVALAANGGLPAAKKKGPVQDKLLELKLLNDDVRLEKESEALKKLQLGMPKQLPQEIQAALLAADKAANEAATAAAELRQKELLAEVKKELAGGLSPSEVRQRLRPRLFVFDFNPSGSAADLRPQSTANSLKELTRAINFILCAASKHDEALLRLTSPGGAVAPYGHAAAQLQRLRDAGVPLTACVDTVAASGGYMMAVVANHIIAAPFSMVGSIGVLAGVPNVHKVLERNDVEFLQVTGGKYKRTVNVLTPNTEEGLAKFKSDIDDIHEAFKTHVHRWRPGLDIEQVSTGEVWLGAAAQTRGLVDALGTSDGQIRLKVEEGFDAIELGPAKKEKKGLAKLMEGFGGACSKAASAAVSSAGDAASGTWRKMLRGTEEAQQARVEAPGLHESRL